MSRLHVDYDRVAPGYDRRHADGGLKGPAHALQALARDVGAGRVLEVGCGTGHWLQVLHTTLPAPAGPFYGLDLSTGMLTQARARGAPLHLVRGRAGGLPFGTSSFDLVYCVNAIHHFDAPGAFVAEARRLLRPGGALAVIGTDPRRIGDRWYVYDYFDGTYETDLARFPSWGTIVDWMAAAGFEPVDWRVVERIVDAKVGRAVLDDPFLRKDATSQLTLLSDEAYAAGLRRVEEAVAAAEASGRQATFGVDLLLGMVTGRA
ncbi:MAG TPA: methyltransferase domain-containing protein [Anaerolineae bacterium]|nr:methyltransferase domain-containing protein [Anaerolineae bacterium]